MLQQLAGAASYASSAPGQVDVLAASWLESMLQQLPGGTDVCSISQPSWAGGGLLLCRLTAGQLPLLVLLPPPCGDSEAR